MQNQQLPVLIFAQSGRFLAQSASQAGYRVWLADYFCDQDSIQIAERWQALDPISTLSEADILSTFLTLSKGEECLLICGCSIEQFYPILDNLPSNITLIGNTASSIDLVKTPSKFFSLLKKLDLKYPETQFKQPEDDGWLAKSPSGFGGSHIHYLKSAKKNEHYYYQRYISGISGSALFLANGEKALLFTVNQQNLNPCDDSPFRLGSISSPGVITQQHQQQLKRAINNITSETKLRGFNSIDFIISDHGELLILEINPRISASAELLNDTLPIFQYHLNACNGLLADIPSIGTLASATLMYLYADSHIVIPANMVWPETCHDIPKPGENIAKNEPICSVVLQQSVEQSIQQYFENIRHKVSSQLIPKILEDAEHTTTFIPASF